MNLLKPHKHGRCLRAGQPVVWWLARVLGTTEPTMRRLLSKKAPPGFFRTKGRHWRVRGAVTNKRLEAIRRFYELTSTPEMTLDKLREFDTHYAEMVEWSKSCAAAEAAAAAHPLLGPVYRRFKELDAELAATPEDLKAARDFILQTRNLGPLDEVFWKSPHEMVPRSLPRKVADCPRKFRIFIALQSIRNSYEPPPTIAGLATKLGVSRTTLFRWAASEQLDLQNAINVVFELEGNWHSATPLQAADLRREHFGRGAF